MALDKEYFDGIQIDLVKKKYYNANKVNAVFADIQAQVQTLLKKAAADMSDGRFVPNEQTTLCRREDGMILNINLSVYELGIRNGSQLMLI